MPLPLWNKNKGNIKIAQSQVAQTKTLQEQKILEINTQISAIFQNLVFQQEQYRRSVLNFSNLETVYQGMLKNFQRRNVSLIEFVDFMESYSQSIQYLNSIRKKMLVSGQNLNFLMGEDIF